MCMNVLRCLGISRNPGNPIIICNPRILESATAKQQQVGRENKNWNSNNSRIGIPVEFLKTGFLSCFLFCHHYLYEF